MIERAKFLAGFGAVCISALMLVACKGETPIAPEVAPDPAPDTPVVETPDVAPTPDTPVHGDEARVDIPPLGAPALWTVADADTTIHLFGTVHILKPGLEWRTEALDAAMATADALYFEADVSSPEAQANMVQLVPQLGVFTDGTRLSDVLDDEQERELQEAANIVGVPVSALEPMKPWFATVNLSVLALQAQGYDPQSGVETVMTGLANAQGLELRYLESAEQQLTFFADMSMDDQVEFLITSAIQIEDDPRMLDVLVEEWAEGDIDDLARLVTAPDVMGSQGVYDVLIVERNANWVDQIQALLDDETGEFIMAVGAAHLVGPDSVVAMLRAEGVEVEGP